MNRKLLVALFVISLVFNVLFFVFAYVQKVAADDARQRGEAERIRADKNELVAHQAKLEAEHQAARVVACQQEKAGK